MSDLENAPEGSESAPQVNEIEQQAREQGWVPKDEWSGEGKWRDAESFLDRGELYQKISSQRKKLQELERNQQAFNSHLSVVREAEYKRALQALRAEKKAALVDGDPDKLIDVDEKIRAVEREQLEINQPAAPQSNEAVAEQFNEWRSKNSWYDNPDTDHLKAYADAEGIKLAKSGEPPEEVLKKVEALVRRKFPEKFTNPNRSKAGAVESGAGKGSSQKESYPLTDAERNVMNRLVKSGTMTAAQYIADLKAVKG
jgi:Tfp pilus assembly protein PilN